MIGDFTLLHGNDKKMNYAALYAASILSAGELFEITNTEPVCYRPEGNTVCNIEITFTITPKHGISVDEFTYRWIAPGNVTVINENNNEITVLLTDIYDDVEVVMQCEVCLNGRCDIKTHTIFATSVEVPPLSATSITRLAQTTCTCGDAPFDAECECFGRYEVMHNTTGSNVEYKWSLENANGAYIFGDDNKKTVDVKSMSCGDTPFTLKCEVSDGFTSDWIKDDFIYTRTRYYAVGIDDIRAIAEGECSYDTETETECTAEATYYAIYSTGANPTEWLWGITSGNAEIIGDTNQSQVTVRTTSGQDETFTLWLRANDNYTVDTQTKSFTHNRIPLINVEDIIEVQHGTCTTPEESTCLASGRYKVQYTGGEGVVSYQWQVSGGGAYIYGSDTDEYVEIRTDNGEVQTAFTLTCTVSDAYKSETVTKDFTHDRTFTNVPIEIEYINETQAGYCEYIPSGTCVATSAYTTNVRYETGTILYQWAVDNGATITSGQGTDTITVQTEGNTDITFNVTLFVKDDLDDSDTMTISATHDREENDITLIVYDQDDIIYDTYDVSYGDVLYRNTELLVHNTELLLFP